ncbi:DDE_Tnp_IS1595 domain-containing protein [Trichonephila clavipes]|nr:DDE_Tnp_IS1595 domain-containing protein [Trichonephila clavipes]
MCVYEGSMLRGPDVIVELDENMFGKRKYNRGKRVNGTWVFGGIEKSSNKCSFHVVQDRSKDILLHSIKSNIKEGTTVISDCLEDEGFLPLSVNHSMHFKDPETGAQTNSIEGSWNAIKKSLHRIRRCKNQFDSCHAEYMWRKMKRPSNPNDLFTAFFRGSERNIPSFRRTLLNAAARWLSVMDLIILNYNRREPELASPFQITMLTSGFRALTDLMCISPSTWQ